MTMYSAGLRLYSHVVRSDLHQIADYAAQEQLQRSHSRPWVISPDGI